jgi:hypothetical protein
MVLPFPCRSFARGAWITARVFRRRSRAAGSFWRRMPQALSFGAATRPAVRALRVHTSVTTICASYIGRRNGASQRDTTPRSTRRSWRRVVRAGAAARGCVEFVIGRSNSTKLWGPLSRPRGNVTGLKCLLPAPSGLARFAMRGRTNAGAIGAPVRSATPCLHG